MATNTYRIPMQGTVTVDAETGKVTVEIALHEVSHDLQYDYDKQYPNEDTERDQQVITDCLLASPSNFSIRYEMSR